LKPVVALKKRHHTIVYDPSVDDPEKQDEDTFTKKRGDEELVNFGNRIH